MQIDQVKQIPIADIIGKHVKLTRKGTVYSGLCPFHNEKTPSFTVFTKTNTFKCFGCHEGGDGITFLMKLKKLDFLEAVQELCKDHGIEFKQITPEQKKEYEQQNKHKQELANVLQWAADYYRHQATAADNKKALAAIHQRTNEATAADFKIGYATDSWTGLYDAAKKQGYSEKILLAAGLIFQSEKNNKYYDRFRNRIMMPINNMTGTVIGFGGRTLSTDKKEAKYINSPETDLYKKDRVLYGLDRASRSITELDSIYIVEGNFDVVRMHEIGVFNTVAPCGTALTGEHAKLVMRYTSNIVLMLDGDAAGIKATGKIGTLLMEHGAHVKVITLPQGKDPADSFILKEAFEKYQEDNTHTFTAWITNMLLSGAGVDPVKKSEAINKISGLLAKVKDDTTRDLYIEEITKKYEIKAASIKDKLRSINKDSVQEIGEDDEALPPGVDPAEYVKYGFYEYQHKYYFKGRDGRHEVSNFVMEPLFHIKSINEARRLYKLCNVYKRTEVVEMDMQCMTSLQNFRRVIEGVGNYLWMGTDVQFMRLKIKIYDQTPECVRVDNLGWQKEGFYAFSNGIVDHGEFKQIDEHGIVTYGKENYFIPAYSSIYINDKSIYINERRFKYIPNKVSIKDWSAQFVKVYGKHAMTGVCFWLATTFRDLIFNSVKYFPILNHFGPPGGGKSQMAISMLYLYGEHQVNINVNNVTKVAISEHIAEFNNALCWADEYSNDIEPDKVQILKAVYDGIGRKRGTIQQGKKTEVTKVDCGLVLTGQQMTTADIALFTRVILLDFNRSNFTDDEKMEFAALQKIQEKGLSHLTLEILKYRDIIEKNFFREYTDVVNELNMAMKDEDIQDRILRNFASLMCVFKLLKDYVEFAFTYRELFSHCVKSIRYQNNEISQNNEVSTFWSMIEYLLSDNLIEYGNDYTINLVDQITTDTDKNKHLEVPTQVLFLKFSRIYKLYAEHGNRSKQAVLPESTLKYYLQNSIHFICSMRRKKFKDSVSSCFCFNYDKLSKDVSLVKLSEVEMMEQQDDIKEITKVVPF